MAGTQEEVNKWMLIFIPNPENSYKELFLHAWLTILMATHEPEKWKLCSKFNGEISIENINNAKSNQRK